jgi:hypothetical protein
MICDFTHKNGKSDSANATPPPSPPNRTFNMYLDRGYRRKRVWPTSYYLSINMRSAQVFIEYMRTTFTVLYLHTKIHKIKVCKGTATNRM